MNSFSQRLFYVHVKLSFQTVIAFSVAGILYAALGAAGLYFARIYSNDRISSVYELELSNTAQFSARLENLISLGPLMAAKDVEQSKEIILMRDGACSFAVPEVGSKRSAISSVLAATDERLGLAAIETLTAGPEIAAACSAMGSAAKSEPIIFSIAKKFYLPYIAVLFPTKPERLILFSMDNLGSPSSVGVQTLVSSAGEVAWKSNPDSDNPLPTNQIDTQVRKTLLTNLPGLTSFDDDLYASYGPISGKWVLFSFGTLSHALLPVRQLERQLTWLLFGFSFLILVFARKFVRRMAMPLTLLVSAADQLAEGKLETRVALEGDSEFRAIQAGFNHMAEELTRLVEVTKETSKLSSELDLTQKVQQFLFPPKFIHKSGHDIRSVVQNADRCGGDWWGHIELGDEANRKILLLIGDVTGHGAPSALVTAATQGSMSTLTEWLRKDPSLIDDPRELLRLFNHSVFASSGGTLSMSFLVCVLDANAERLTLCNAGHNWPYLITPQPDGTLKLKSIGAASPVLGMDLAQKFDHLETHPWLAESKLLLYTDGLIDCYEGDQNLFDRRSLIRVLKGVTQSDSQTILDSVMKTRERAVKGMPSADDVTVVVCSREVR